MGATPLSSLTPSTARARCCAGGEHVKGGHPRQLRLRAVTGQRAYPTAPTYRSAFLDDASVVALRGLLYGTAFRSSKDGVRRGPCAGRGSSRRSTQTAGLLPPKLPGTRRKSNGGGTASRSSASASSMGRNPGEHEAPHLDGWHVHSAPAGLAPDGFHVVEGLHHRMSVAQIPGGRHHPAIFH